MIIVFVVFWVISLIEFFVYIFIMFGFFVCIFNDVIKRKCIVKVDYIIYIYLNIIFFVDNIY